MKRPGQEVRGSYCPADCLFSAGCRTTSPDSGKSNGLLIICAAFIYVNSGFDLLSPYHSHLQNSGQEVAKFNAVLQTSTKHVTGSS